MRIDKDRKCGCAHKQAVKMMKTDVGKFIKKHYVLLWLVILLSVLTCFYAYGAYTNLNSVKRVVSTQGGSGTAFSSNYLSLTTRSSSSYDMKRITVGQKAETKSFDLNIFNYAQNNPSVYNEYDVTYTLVLTLIDATDGSVITDRDGEASVSGGSFSNGICEITGQTLTGKTKSVLSYAVTVPKSFVNAVNIKAEAIPDEASYSYTNNSKLARIITFSEYIENNTSWTGSFSETTADGYDGFNYIIKGQGVGTVTLTWDPEMLEISKIFLDNNGITPNDGADGKKTFTMQVDSNTGSSRYDIQFYKTEAGGTSGAYADMNAINGYVEFSFAESGT